MTLDLKRRLDLKTFEPEFTPVFVADGGSAMTYRVSQDLIAKFLYDFDHDENQIYLRNDPGAFFSLRYEYTIARVCRKNRISVPIPKGVFNVPMDNGTYPAYIMEYIDGIPFFELKKDDPFYNEAIQKFDIEINKAKRIFCTGDSNGNAIWRPKKRKVILIDHLGWTMKPKSLRLREAA